MSSSPIGLVTVDVLADVLAIDEEAEMGEPASVFAFDAPDSWERTVADNDADLFDLDDDGAPLIVDSEMSGRFSVRFSFGRGIRKAESTGWGTDLLEQTMDAVRVASGFDPMKLDGQGALEHEWTWTLDGPTARIVVYRPGRRPLVAEVTGC